MTYSFTRIIDIDFCSLAPIVCVNSTVLTGFINWDILDCHALHWLRTERCYPRCQPSVRVDHRIG